MDADSWLWIALIAFLIFCCVPMLLMRRHGNRAHDGDEDLGQRSSSFEKTTSDE